jgi:hypothetical protein
MGQKPGKFRPVERWNRQSAPPPGRCGPELAAVLRSASPTQPQRHATQGADCKHAQTCVRAAPFDPARRRGEALVLPTLGRPRIRIADALRAKWGFYLSGADGDNGAVYLVSPPAAPGGAWTQSTLYSFAGTPDGSEPSGNLILNKDGSLYGVTVVGGQYGYGTAYQLIPPQVPGGAWTESILYSFAGPPSDGFGPAALAAGSGGLLYGPTTAGGSGSCAPQGCGTIFQLTPPSAPGGVWQETCRTRCGAAGTGHLRRLGGSARCRRARRHCGRFRLSCSTPR